MASSLVAGQAAHGQDGTVERAWKFTPSVGVQESVTDNADLTSSNRSTEFITRGYIGLDASLNSTRARGTLNAQASYDAYSKSSDRNGFTIQGFGSGVYDIVPDVLTLEADGSVTNGSSTTFGDSAIDRSGSIGRTQLSTFVIGPRLTTTVGDYADLNAVARASQVSYRMSNGSDDNIQLPRDSTIGDIAASLDTANRFNGYQLVGAAQYERDDNDFELYNAVGSAYVSIAPNLRAIGRAGYENIEQPGIINLQSPVWSLGLELTLNERSKITVERGERYDRPVWAASANVFLSDRLYLTGRYSELIQPSQLYISNSFIDFIDQSRQLPPTIVPGNFAFAANLTDQTSLNKTAEGHLIYLWPAQTLDVSVNYTDQLFLGSNLRDRSFEASATLRRQWRPDLNLELEANYGRTYESAFFGESRAYGVSGRAIYNFTPTVDFMVGYAFTDQKQLVAGGDKIYENVGFVSVLKRF